MLAGISSRSSNTSKVHRLYRDGYATASELRAAFDSDAREILSKQREFAFVSGGQVDWLDILRPRRSPHNSAEATRLLSAPAPSFCLHNGL